MQGVALDFENTRFKVHGIGLNQRLRPGFDQGVHAGGGHPVLVLCVACGFDHAAHGIEHAHGIGAPGLANLRGGGQRLCESIIAHGEVLRTMVEAAKAGRARRHAAAGAFAFFKDGDAMAGLHQGARAGNACHAGTHDGEILNGLCLGICFCHGATLHAIVGLEQCLFGAALL